MTPTDLTPPDLDPDDEVALPSFEAALWAELRAEHARTVATASGSAGSGSDGTDHRRARGARSLPVGRWAAGAAAAVLLVAAGAVVVTRGGADDGERTVVRPVDDPTTTTAPVPIDLQVAAVVERLLAENVVLATTIGADGMVEQEAWSDDATGALRIRSYQDDGQPKLDMGWASRPPADPGVVVDPQGLTVDACAGQYAYGVVPTVSGDLANVAMQIRRSRMVPDGTVVVDGEELLRFRAISLGFATPEELDHEMPTPTLPGGEVDLDDEHVVVDRYNALLVDPDTLEPRLRTTIDAAGGDVTVTYELVPRSDPGALGLLVPLPPADAVEVDAVPTDDERFALGCF